MTELLPCPWCGSDIRLSPINVPWSDNEPCWAIWHIDGTKAYEAKCPMEMGGYDTEAEAIAAWNTRDERVGERKTINKTGDFVPHDSRAERTCTNVDKYASSGFFICGNCGFGDNAIELTPNYCPNCGAKVVGE